MTLDEFVEQEIATAREFSLFMLNNYPELFELSEEDWQEQIVAFIQIRSEQ